MNEIINNILTQVSNGAFNTIGALMITKLLQTLSGSNNFFKDIFIRLEKEIKQENLIEEDEIEFTKILPIMDGLMLNQDNKPMSEMFYNLLKSSMDKETKDFVHPAFPQILKQMSPQEAKLLFDIYKNAKIYRTYKARIDKNGIFILDISNKKEEKVVYVNEKEDFSFIFERLKYFGLAIIEDSTKSMDKLTLAPSKWENVMDKIKLSDFGQDLMKVLYSKECDKLFDTIELKEYFEKLSKK